MFDWVITLSCYSFMSFVVFILVISILMTWFGTYHLMGPMVWYVLHICCTQNAINNEMRIRFNDVQRRLHFGRFCFLIKTLNKNREKINQFEYFFVVVNLYFRLAAYLYSVTTFGKRLKRMWVACLRLHTINLLHWTKSKRNETK